MAELIWTEPALLDLDAVADYIELDNPPAARRYVHHVFAKTAHLKKFPELGTAIPELDGLPMYRQLVLPPCRIFYKITDNRVFILHIMRCEQLLRMEKLFDSLME